MHGRRADHDQAARLRHAADRLRRLIDLQPRSRLLAGRRDPRAPRPPPAGRSPTAKPSTSTSNPKACSRSPRPPRRAASSSASSTKNEGFANPRERTQALVKDLKVELPQGVTLNPSVGAGLGVCTPAQLAAESAFNPPAPVVPTPPRSASSLSDCPTTKAACAAGSTSPSPMTRPRRPGAENPFDSLLAVYLVAKSADRGMLIRIPGKLTPDPGDGTITATFDGLPQLPYTHLEVNFRSSQRAPLISPPSAARRRTEITLGPWSEGVADSSPAPNPDHQWHRLRPLPDGNPPPSPPKPFPAGSTPTSAPTPPTTCGSRAATPTRRSPPTR